MRLLRGDPDMLQVLDDMERGHDHPCHRFLINWKLVKKRGKERPSLMQPGLGITAHAGEDFADALDGLYQIGVAVEYLKMQAGDSIGHGLALKVPVGSRSPARNQAPLGAAHDSLCWLHDLLEKEYHDKRTDWNPGSLRDMIVTTGKRIYRDVPKADAKSDAEYSGAVAAARYDDFVWVWKHKLLPVCDDLNSASGLRRDLIEKEYDNHIIKRRDEIRALPEDRSELNGLVEAAQGILLQKIIDRRIVVEMNPSSNIRISGARRAGDSPTVRLIKATLDGLLATINTDNPGVFATCIENEYAMLLRGLVEEQVPEAEARRLLEGVRGAGLGLLHWPPRPADSRSHTDKSSNDPRGSVRDGVPPSP
jgi:hypothetical protein